MKKALISGLSVASFIVPSIAAAQAGGDLRAFVDLVIAITNIVNLLIPLLIGVALVVFFIGLIRYLWGANKGDHSSGKKLMIWGLVTLFVMVSVWGIVRLAQNALLGNTYGDTNTIQSPYIPGPFNPPRP